jgi:hypothetical protein
MVKSLLPMPKSSPAVTEEAIAESMLSAGLRRSAPKVIRWKRSRRSCGDIYPPEREAKRA